MELEQRVKTLEYEMKILKNEVQRTLLDIQEQVLVHYYPALRADETKPSEGTIQAIQTLRSRPGAPSSDSAPAAAAPPPAEAPAAPAPPGPVQTMPVAPAPAPTLKKVSLDEIRAAQSELVAEEAAKTGGAGGGAAANAGGNASDPTGNLKLLEWLMSNAAKPAEGGDGKSSNQMLEELNKLKTLVGDASNMEEALKRLQEAKLG